jgi:hypothetical protein
MLLDWMVTGGILPFNPASSVRGPKYVVKKGKTPVLTPEEARALPQRTANLVNLAESDPGEFGERP